MEHCRTAHKVPSELGPWEPVALSEVSILAGNDTQDGSLELSETNPIEPEDPLHNDNVLLHGLRIVNPGDDSTVNAIRKVPSDQTFPMFRWGYVH